MAAVEVLKHFAHLHHNVGAIHFAEGRFGPAIRCFNEAVSWSCQPAADALMVLAGVAHRAASEAYNNGVLTVAVTHCRDARRAVPDDHAIETLARSLAARTYNQGVGALARGDMSEAADLLFITSELDPNLEAVRRPLANALRAVASSQFEAGRVQEALSAFDRLLALGSPGPADQAMIHSVELWLREGFSRQMSELKIGGAVFLLKQLARLAPKSLGNDLGLIEGIGELARLLAKHASEQPLEVLDAVVVLQPLAPSSQLAFAGASAYKLAITEAQRLHTAGETLKAVEYCGPSMRYRPRGPDRQLSHALATLLCRKVMDLLESGDRVEALALHERTLDFLEDCRSPGIVTA